MLSLFCLQCAVCTVQYLNVHLVPRDGPQNLVLFTQDVEDEQVDGGAVHGQEEAVQGEALDLNTWPGHSEYNQPFRTLYLLAFFFFFFFWENYCFFTPPSPPPECFITASVQVWLLD